MTTSSTYAVAYSVLADLFEHGVPADDEARMSALLGVAVKHEPGAHYEALGLAVPPHESVFVDPEGVVGGEVSQRVVDTYARLGFAYDVTGPAPDHLAVQLRALASTCAGAASAQRVMLDVHLLGWVPLFAHALRGFAPYDIAASTLLGVLLEHRATLGPHRGGAPVAEVSIDLEDRKTSLRDIAGHLCRPAACGLWISRFDVTRFARGVSSSHGFGERALMLENLMHSAADRDALPALLTALGAEVDELREHLSGVPDVYAAPWLGRLARTERTLAAMQHAQC
ncbi:MAG: molecular chaperone TorD family protein [Deltaproteobacteria bacterium]|jgi:hypothetical protein